MAPLIVITGPTASGKTALALRLAERWDGEIVCADSRTIYTGLDIGTAKPTLDEKRRVHHHLLDIVQPSEQFTAHDFQQRAQRAIADIRMRNKIPLLVGGSGLYVDSVVLGYSFAPPPSPKYRQALEDQSINQLQSLIKNQHILMPENKTNKRYLIRALERSDYPISGKIQPDTSSYVVAIATDSVLLRRRIRTRIEVMLEDGVIDEAQTAAQHFGWDAPGLSGNIYRHVKQYLDGVLSYEDMIERSSTNDWHLAKRQITWLRRHAYVRWLNVHEAEQYFNHILSNYRDACSD